MVALLRKPREKNFAVKSWRDVDVLVMSGGIVSSKLSPMEVEGACETDAEAISCLTPYQSAHGSLMDVNCESQEEEQTSLKSLERPNLGPEKNLGELVYWKMESPLAKARVRLPILKHSVDLFLEPRLGIEELRDEKLKVWNLLVLRRMLQWDESTLRHSFVPNADTQLSRIQKSQEILAKLKKRVEDYYVGKRRDRPNAPNKWPATFRKICDKWEQKTHTYPPDELFGHIVGSIVRSQDPPPQRVQVDLPDYQNSVQRSFKQVLLAQALLQEKNRCPSWKNEDPLVFISPMIRVLLGVDSELCSLADKGALLRAKTEAQRLRAANLLAEIDQYVAKKNIPQEESSVKRRFAFCKDID